MRSSRRAGVAPTLSDVARAAGVSPMTVSRVVNRDARVRPETRERVEQAIASLKYAPNAAARELAGAARTRIALLYGNPSAAYLSEVLVGALAMASRSDVQLLLERCADAIDPDEAAERLAAAGVDGVILPPPFSDRKDLIARLQDAGTPIALIASGAPAEGCFAVAIDDARAAADMTRELIALGHRRIGFVVGNPNQTAAAQRLAGYRLALADAGIAADPALIAQGDFSYRSGLAAAERLLAVEPRPTVIFASNDDMAAAVVAAAHRHHLETPRDLSVCGFDDTALATTLSPELTTVRQPAAEMAEAAVEMLSTAARRRRQGEPAAGRTQLFAHEIILRESAAPPGWRSA